MHVSGSEENFKQFTALVLKVLMKKNIGNLFVRLFVVSLLTFHYFFYNCIHFRSRSRPVFYGSGSGSGSEQTVSAAPAPAPTKMCRLWRLRLRLRIPASTYILMQVWYPTVMLNRTAHDRGLAQCVLTSVEVPIPTPVSVN